MLKFLLCVLCYIWAINSQSLYRYEIIVDHLEFPKRDELFDYGTLRAKKYNRTTYVLSGHFDILKPFSDEIESQFDMYQLQGNEYRKIIQKKYQNICTAIKEDKLIFGKGIKKTTLGPEIKSCPLQPQRVHFYDVNVPGDFLPLEPPRGEKYRMDVIYGLNNKIVTNYSVYFSLKKMDDNRLSTMPKLP